MKGHPSEEKKKKIEDQEESQDKGTIFKKGESNTILQVVVAVVPVHLLHPHMWDRIPIKVQTH